MNDQEIAPEIVDEKTAANSLVLPEQTLPEQVYVIPIHNRPFFPAQVLPVVVNPDPWAETLKRVVKTPQHSLALFYMDPPPEDAEDFDPDKLPEHGTLVRVHHASQEGGKLQFVAQGLARVRIRGWLSRKPPYLVEVDYPKSAQDPRDEVKAYGMALINAIKELLPLNPLYSEELKNYLNRFSPNEPSPLTDFAAALTTAPSTELQEVLDTVPVLKRMEKVLPLLRKEVEVARLQNELSAEVNRQIGERQREFFLKEQLKIIQRELGITKDDKSADADEFRARLEGKVVPAAARKRIDEELNKLSILETGSPEYAVTRNYLDWATSIPWGVYGKDRLDLAHARKVLDKHHAGMDDIKARITEFLAVGAFKGEIAGSIVLLVGPPGVGKTSIGKSIAESLGRPFYRFSVGGMRDEAEIKGHRRTYIGALPGKLVQALKDVEVMNPVIMLDEIDKLGASHHGDPASALLETLDPEQNAAFLDHYLDLRLDLSKVLFVCTANTLDSIPGPLLDRMEVIRLSGYIAEEKFAIAKRHLWPRQLEKAGVPKNRLSISDSALKAVIEGYAREAGVRQLEKQLGKIVRKAVVRLLEAPEARLKVGPRDLEDYLGMPPFRKERRLEGVGIITGLAWTSMGGATLPIEATRIHTLNRGFKLTGKLGEVMKESAEIAYSYVSSHLKQYKGDPTFFDQAFVHLHVPEGATPKDGPSAGISMASALLSLARNQAPKKDVAMTGELTLTGQVLAIGGVREKVIAARRQKIFELVLPEANRGDFEELPAYLREGLTVHFARTFSDVARVLFPHDKP
ncbi:ATP-dependent protease La [Azotobacter vinelandii CA]|uniref:Lon protease n=2 Tax=Azotobacter vinelandii TaxID=354 RepID=C1DQT6_AZOVD|nr:endopeptidase La [Azotobacter vinelandii]ACO77609.1 ATP-dependent protease La [Azotobacter vinelandii DJ]AGK13677.1 ATP-dependent protease La [Azotobacter vinelandii CA]AGK18219.1 ATP-dependent protease La [Azotobacter vinelandii CA6]SFX98339.1 ATP-dependent Lon protease [Azotobacter vinelandii]GLK61276.1 Lon protease [Azotobacter vinelandii]